MNEIQTKEKELGDIDSKVEDINLQRAKIDIQIKAQEKALADAITNEKQTSPILSNLDKLKLDYENNDRLINAACSRHSLVKAEIIELKKEDVAKEVTAIHAQYDENLVKIIESLAQFWEAAQKMEQLSNRANQLCRTYKIDDEIYYSSLSVGQSTLKGCANLALYSFEKAFPQACKKVKYPSYSERSKLIYHW